MVRWVRRLGAVAVALVRQLLAEGHVRGATAHRTGAAHIHAAFRKRTATRVAAVFVRVAARLETETKEQRKTNTLY